MSQEFNLQEGIKNLTETVSRQSPKKPLIIGVAGGSSSGKTNVFCAEIKNRLGDRVGILSMDDYYRDLGDLKKEKGLVNWDCPEALDLDLFLTHLKKIKKGQGINKPVYNKKLNKRVEEERFEPTEVVLVEGLFALASDFIPFYDLKIFIEAQKHGRIVRRLFHYISETGRSPENIIRYFTEIVEPMHQKFVEPGKLIADWVVKNDYDPQKEAEKFGLYRVQFKFKRKLDSKKIKEAGGKEIELLKQTDAYYYPFRGNFGQTGETLRIRQEKDAYLFIYEGPPIDSDFKKRAAFKFELSKHSAERFVDVYGFRAATITKERRVFELDGIKFSCDRVFGQKGELAEKELGYFVEIFLDEEKEMEKEKTAKLLKKLGLSTEYFTTDSYLEILVKKGRG